MLGLFFWYWRHLCVRNLFHQNKRWMENSITTFWGIWGKSSGANIRTSGATTPGPCIMTTHWLMRCLLCSSFGLLRRLLTHQTSPRDLFLFTKIKLKLEGLCFDSNDAIEQYCRAWWDPEAIWLPAVILIMEILLGSLYQCRRGWQQIEISGKWLRYSRGILGTFG